MGDARAVSPTIVRSVARASKLLHLLAAGGAFMPLGEIAKAAGLPKSTTHGLLQTLVGAQLVEHDSTCGAYRLSPRLVLGPVEEPRSH